MQRRGVGVFGAFGRRRDDLVVARDLEHALGAAWRGSDEHDQFLLLARAADLGDPVLHAAAELDDRLTGDVPHVPESSAPGGPNFSSAASLFDAQLLSRMRRSRSTTVSRSTNSRSRRRHRPGRRATRRPGLAGERLVARRGLLEEGVDGRKHLVGFGDDEDGAAAEVQILENRGLQPQVRGRRVVGLPEAFANGHDARLVDGPRRALGGRVVAADRLHRVADELDAQRLGVAGREHVHDAAAHAELAVLVDGILAGESGFDELLGQQERADVDPWAPGPPTPTRAERAAPGAAAAPAPRSRPRAPGPRRFGEGARAGGRDLQVRRQAAIRVDLVTGQRHDGIGDRGCRPGLRAHRGNTVRPTSARRRRRRSARRRPSGPSERCWRAGRRTDREPPG